MITVLKTYRMVTKESKPVILDRFLGNGIEFGARK
jgi:hypothetical protein